MFSSLRLDLLSFGIAVAAGVILGFIVFFRDRKSVTNILFLIFTIISSIWGILNYLAYQIFDPVMSLWIVRFVMFLAVYQAFIFFLLMYVFPKSTLDFHKRWFYAVTFVVVLVSLLTLTPFVFSDVVVNLGSAPSPKPAPGIALFALVAISCVIAGVVMLLKRIRSADEKERAQFKALFLGVILMFTSIIVFNFIFVAFLNNSSFIPLSGIFILPFIVFTFYAIARHELLDVKIIGTEVITLLLVIISFAEVILSSTLGEIIFRIGVFFALLIVGVLLIRSVLREVEQRQKLQELTEKLKALDKQKDEFISMAAHELRSPLTAIKGYISMIVEGDTGEIPAKAKEFLVDSESVTDRLIRLINNMLNVSRIEEGRLVYQIEVVDLIKVMQETYYSFRFEAERKGVKFNLEVPNGLSDKVKVDPDRIREVIGNIVSNAIKFTEKGSVTIKMDQPSPASIRVSVIDTGPGISKEEQVKLFQKFYRAESTAGKTIGTGLGLYITRLLVEKFGGSLGVMSEVDKGSTFWFEIPIYTGGIAENSLKN